ncbi:efflux RND transporter periplasmic adaptor subunit [Chamaesiphon minutus]|uniref:RND family efflux transporter, MFP subunit n=1 Tax=Chamaesiphon minutus (strain ATCC 27169 / PCC 6605) TaxID=1173020 RepID=K9UEX5_CHAP6|nr:efflux RND transporter periplasmic adaptor subunit [Chamaesiphon minutus]AFY92976.1 RND family efflux transporter, MFP subunit [Chamaesiphon minutus PCC 6605]
MAINTNSYTTSSSITPAVRAVGRLSWLLLPIWISLVSPSAFAHGGHGNEFGSQEGTKSTKVQVVDGATAQQIGVQTVAAKKQSLNVEIAATGQIELLPSKKVEVTAPIKGKLVQLLVQPGARVKAGQILATLSSPELNDLRTSSLEKRSTALALLQQAQTDRNLAQQSYQKIVQIAAAETDRANSQLAAAQSRLAREQQLVKSGSIVQAAKTSYQRQQQIATAEISSAQTELELAQERYQKDLELVKSGALARRQMLESQAKLAAARTALVRAQSQAGVAQAATDLRKAETDLPLRELRDAEKQVADARAELARAMNQKSVVEAQAQFQRANSAVTAAQTQLRLSDASYQGRLAQLGNRANAQGIVTVTAPIDGTIADREITIGQSVADAGARLMTITDDRQVLATANIYERDLGRLKIGQQVSVKVPGMADKVFSGQISRIGTAVDSQSRVVPVQATLDNSQGLLKAGTFAEIKLATGQITSPVVVIPAGAVVEADQEKLVYVKSGDSYQPTTVTLGQTVGDLVEVKTGLFAGDLVVNKRAPQLYAQSLKKKPASEDKATTEAKPDNAVSQNQIPTYLIWGLVPVAGILGGSAWWLKKRSERNANSSTDLIEPEDELNYLPVEEIHTIEEDSKQHNSPNSSQYPQIGATSRDVGGASRNENLYR